MRSSRNTSAEPRFQFGWLVAIAIFLSSTIGSLGAVPFTLHFQGHLGADGTAIDGPGEFKFALIDGAGAVVWSNSGIPEGGSEPSAAVMVTIEGGFYAVQLGDESVANMAALTLEALRADDLLLRVWFNDGQASFEQLSPDHVLSSAAFAVTAHHAERADVAESVSDGAIGLSGLEDSLANLISELNDKITELETFKETVEGSLSTTTMVSIDPEDANLLSAGFQRFTSLAEGRWLNGDGARQPLARTQHSAVWTGQEMIVWGGTLPGGISGDGAGLYRPDLDRWSPLSPINVLSDRRQHSAVWTGTEMIVWGGFGFPGYLGDGSRFNPATRIWQAISMLGAPLSRGGHGAVWTGSVMLVWGGRDGDGLIGNGALYDPTTDTWTPLPDVGAPSPRFEHSMVWAGDRLLVWGGERSRWSLAWRWRPADFQRRFPDWMAAHCGGRCTGPAIAAFRRLDWNGSPCLGWAGEQPSQ